MKKKTDLIFTYGTLMTGMPNNPRLNGAKSQGRATTVEKYELRAAAVPYVNKNHKTHVIQGEVFEVDLRDFPRVDQLEGHPTWYCRERIPVRLASGQTVKAWIYFNNRAEAAVVPSGDFRKVNQGDRRAWTNLVSDESKAKRRKRQGYLGREYNPTDLAWLRWIGADPEQPAAESQTYGKEAEILKRLL
jgi:gamma-glutamylcyclotransferase (GGCT)/AIG2-like uncharacterized protein YtfP